MTSDRLSHKLSDVPPLSSLHIWDSATDGRVSKAITAWRADGQSVTEIGRHLFADFQISVTERTVYRWLDELSAGNGAQDGAA